MASPKFSSRELPAEIAFYACLLGGAAAVTYGAFLLHPAAGWVTGGVFAIVAALRVLP